MSLKSLKKDLENQKRIVKSTNKQIQEVEHYCDHVNAQMISLTSAWEDNADRNGILKTMASCVSTAAEIAYDYSTFSVNAVNYLNNIESLEAFAKYLIPGKAIKKKPFFVPVIKRKNRISVHPDILLDVAACMEGYSADLDAIKVETGSLNARIDSIIINRITPKYSLKSIQKRIDVLSKMNRNVAQNLKAIAENYNSVEKQLAIVAADLANGAQSSNAVSSEIKKIYADNRSASTYNMPEVKKYTNEIGQISILREEQYINYINERNGQLETQGENLRHHCTKHTKEKLEKIGISFSEHGYGNGNTWYNALKNRQFNVSQNIKSYAYDGESFWEQLYSGNIDSPVHNIVISYDTPNDQWGHVLMIDAIVKKPDGSFHVYYSDNYATPGASGRGRAVEYDLEYFRNQYRNQDYRMQGAVHFAQ